MCVCVCFWHEGTEGLFPFPTSHHGNTHTKHLCVCVCSGVRTYTLICTHILTLKLRARVHICTAAYTDTHTHTRTHNATHPHRPTHTHSERERPCCLSLFIWLSPWYPTPPSSFFCNYVTP